MTVEQLRLAMISGIDAALSHPMLLFLTTDQRHIMEAQKAFLSAPGETPVRNAYLTALLTAMGN